MNAQQAFSLALDSRVEIEQRQRAGASSAEAIGAVVGSAAGAGACAATGLGAAVSPLCGMAGGLVGSLVGGLFGGSGDDPELDAFCDAFGREVTRIAQAYGVPRGTVRQWAKDGAIRAMLTDTAWKIQGEVGASGAYLTPYGVLPFGKNGKVDFETVAARNADRHAKEEQGVSIREIHDKLTAFRPVEGCLQGGVRPTAEVRRAASVGLLAAAIRARASVGGVSSSAGLGALWLALGAAAAAGLLLWKK